MPRPRLVATAAPVTPSAGKGPRPKTRHGPSTMLSGVGQPQHAHRDRGVAGAAEHGVDEEEQHHRGVAAEHDRACRSLPVSTIDGDAPISAQQRRRGSTPTTPMAQRHADAEGDRLHGGAGRAVGILLADAAGDGGRGADAQPHRQGVEQRQHRLGEPDRGHRVGAEPADEEHVAHREQRLHQRLEHHRDGEQPQRPADRTVGVVVVGAARARRARVATTSREDSRRGIGVRPSVRSSS